jgi:hypothetical protein
MGVLSHGYQRLLPRRFWLSSAASNHHFGVVNPWWQPYEIVQLKSGKLSTIEPSAYCELLLDGSYVPLLIPVAKYPVAATTVTQLAQLSTGGRAGKYLALFKVYEMVCAKPQIRFAALRHALSHAVSILNRPKTIEALISMFGTVHVDLARHRHQVVFWRTLGELLIEVDRLVTHELKALTDVVMPQSYKRPLTVWIARYHFPDELSKLLSNRTVENDAPRASPLARAFHRRR